MRVSAFDSSAVWGYFALMPTSADRMSSFSRTSTGLDDVHQRCYGSHQRLPGGEATEAYRDLSDMGTHPYCLNLGQ